MYNNSGAVTYFIIVMQCNTCSYCNVLGMYRSVSEIKISLEKEKKILQHNTFVIHCRSLICVIPTMVFLGSQFSRSFYSGS